MINYGRFNKYSRQFSKKIIAKVDHAFIFTLYRETLISLPSLTSFHF